MGFLSRDKTEEEGRDAVLFIFSWKKDHRPSWHLFLFVLFSTLVHGSGFYLFQIVYPEPVRVEPTPDFVTILDFSNPAVRPAIQRAKDRTVFLHAPSESSVVRVKLNDHAVRLTPSYTKIRPVFLPPRNEKNYIPQPFGKRGISMPDSGGISLNLSADLKKRGIAPWSVLRDYLRSIDGLPALRVNLKVLPDGKISSAKIESKDLPDSVRTEFNRAVESTLRFRPLLNQKETEIMQGWVEIRPKAK